MKSQQPPELIEATPTTPTPTRPKVGRPTKYKPEYVDLAYEACKTGAINAQLATRFDISLDTLFVWRKQHPEFADAIDRGKAECDAQVQSALFRRAIGFEHPAVKIFCQYGTPIEVPYTERYPPDTNAMIFWLKNRRPDEWKDTQHTEHSGIITHAVDAPPQETREQWLARKAAERAKIGISEPE